MTGHPVLRLGEIATVVAGNPAPQAPAAFAPNGPLFVRMKDVGLHHVNPALSVSTDQLSPSWLTANRIRLFPKDSILIPKSGASVNLNHRAKLATDAYVASHLAVVIPDKGRVDPDYLFWWSVRYDPRAQAQVTSLPSLKLSTLKEALVPLPPLDEQRRIVGILNRAARIERLRAQGAERLQEFMPALFVKMFGDPAENPMGWDVKPFTHLVEDGTRYVKKIPRREYTDRGQTPVVDQGKRLVAGYSNREGGSYQGTIPAIVFGDHTRRFKLVRFRFFLGADGTKLLLPKPNGQAIDPVFLYGHLKCLAIDDAGYSRHFKFLKRKFLMLPRLEDQLAFRSTLEAMEKISTMTDAASGMASAVTSSLTAHLLQHAA